MDTVLITGVDKGIGRALAEKFLAQNYLVLGTSCADSLNYSHQNLRVFPLDLASPESIAACARAFINTGKKPKILINNAGVLLDEDATSIVVDKLRKTLEVNLIGTADFTERIIPLLENSSHIVNISSVAGSLEEVGQSSHHVGYYPSYKISKAALNMYTRTLALRLKPSGITVSSVHPGWVRTDMGGPEADISPEEAAESIFKLATSQPPTGGFWFNGERVPW